MVIHDNDHDQGFTNLDERDMINTTHAYFEKDFKLIKRGLLLPFEKIKLGLHLKEFDSTIVITLQSVKLKLIIILCLVRVRLNPLLNLKLTPRVSQPSPLNRISSWDLWPKTFQGKRNMSTLF